MTKDKLNNGRVLLSNWRIFEDIKKWEGKKSYIIGDFDWTFTPRDSETSWSVLVKSGLMPVGFVNERNVLHDHYFDKEKNPKIPEDERRRDMKEWYGRMLQLVEKYGLNEGIIKEVARMKDLMFLRNGAEDFLHICRKKGIPVIIVSAGIGNIIEEFLRYHECLENVTIIANFIGFENGVISGFSKHRIHSANKGQICSMKKVQRIVYNREHAIMLGDSVDDIKMVPEEKREQTIKVGFLDKEVEERLPDYRQEFDMVCANNCSLEPATYLVNLIA